MSVAMVTKSKDDTRQRGSDVNKETVRHSCRLQTRLVPGSDCDVVVRAWLEVHGGKGPSGVQADVSDVMTVGSCLKQMCGIF